MIANPATAKSLSHVIPPSILNRADEVIEWPLLAPEAWVSPNPRAQVLAMIYCCVGSREDRDRANKAIMEDEAFKEVGKNIPVDMKRMFTGGFKVLRGMWPTAPPGVPTTSSSGDSSGFAKKSLVDGFR
jgi:hypothetical protein